jgi:SAM-dependent methyltransferase
MELTNPQRVAKLTADLLRHPQRVPRYLAHNVVARRTPLDLALPWFSYAAIEFLEGYLEREMRVFEFGSGGSTLFFAARCARVTGVEDDANWRQLVLARAEERGLKNVALRHAPFDFNRQSGFETSEYLNEVREAKADVIVVDGNDPTFTFRPICFRTAEAEIAPGGIVIVDDSWRYTQLREDNRAREVRVFESAGPARFGVTSTDVYFY